MNNEALTNKDIVVSGLQPWDFRIGSNCRDIAKELAKSNRILYVNRCLDRISLLRSRKDSIVQTRLKSIKGIESPLKQVQDNLWVLNPRVLLESINFVPSGPLFDWLNKRNNRLIAGEIRRAISELGFKDVTLFNDNDFVRSFYLAELIPHEHSVYYLRDNLTLQPYFKKRANLERELMTKSSFILTNSEYLADYASNYNKNAHFVGQGFDTSPFDIKQVKRPRDLNSISGPIVGYVGSLTSERLDVQLISFLAKKAPDISFVLVGPQDAIFENSDLQGLPNVHFLGPKSEKEVPSYIGEFDVCFNPQLINYLTIGNYPRKIDEYLIMGKPVVATKTQGMRYFESHTYLAESYEDFMENIKLAISEDSKQRQEDRKGFARSHTWENSVKMMRRAIEV